MLKKTESWLNLLDNSIARKQPVKKAPGLCIRICHGLLILIGLLLLVIAIIIMWVVVLDWLRGVDTL